MFASHTAGDAEPGGALRGEQALAGRLRAVKLRVTRPRLRLLALLSEGRGHLSADDIVAALRAQGRPLSRAAVYNILGTLVSHGLLMVTDAGPGRTLYEAFDHWHHHFVCQSCGVILDVPCVVGESPCLLPDQIDAEVATAQVIFRGRCRDCIERGAQRASAG